MKVRLVACPSILLLGLVIPTALPERRGEGVPAGQARGVPEAPRAWTVSPPWSRAAEATRRRDFATVRELLTPLAEGPAPASGRARLLLGLYAHAAEEIHLAAEWLASTSEPGGELEDWRLFLLADALRADGDPAGAAQTLEVLLGTHPRSLLWPAALVAAVELATEQQEWAAARRWLETGRQAGLSGARGARLERAAWEVGEALGNRSLQEQTARRLLTEHPEQAAELAVVDLFREPSGSVPWAEVLFPGELHRRARRLLDLELHDAALSALDAVPAGERGFDWHLLRSETLVGQHRGDLALETLGSVTPVSRRQEAQLEWQRALAALDVSRARRGRRNLPVAERRAQHGAALDSLRRVSDAGADPGLTRRALRLLFAELADDERSEEAVEVLRALRRLEPEGTTGARYLWRQGWRQFERRNYTGAVGFWSELRTLYPETTYDRSGRYWTARAHEHLGNRRRATTLLREIVAADTRDFYSRHAQARLSRSDGSSLPVPAHAQEPWPEDPLLERPRLLSDLGLDELALLEMEALQRGAEPRAFSALKALLLARQGRRRESIQALARAFPQLGGPRQASVPEAARRLYYPLDFAALVLDHAREQGLPASLVFAMIRQESAFDAAAKSRAGARGLMQMMPATGRELARRFGLPYSTQRLLDPDFSIRLGTAYYRQVLEMFDGNEELALAGYNGGPNRIRRLWRAAGVRPELDHFLESLYLEETKRYVKRIVLFTDSYLQLYPEMS